jgi:hypothetical protein
MMPKRKRQETTMEMVPQNNNPDNFFDFKSQENRGSQQSEMTQMKKMTLVSEMQMGRLDTDNVFGSDSDDDENVFRQKKLIGSDSGDEMVRPDTDAGLFNDVL